jgi:hypothetical protein
MLNKAGLLFICTFLFPAKITKAQEINVVLKNLSLLDTENRLNIVRDVNGDTCNSLIINTGWKGLKFYSNLGVEKIAVTGDGYHVWIPYQARSIKFIIPGFQLFDYELPPASYKYITYNLEITAKKGERHVLQDTLKPRLSFSTNPSKAKVFVNNEYKGKSPLLITDPGFTEFTYRIKKKGYSIVFEVDSINTRLKNIHSELNDLSRSKRYFLALNAKLNTDMSPPPGEFYPFYGLLFGTFGKTGYFGSLNLFLSDNNAPVNDDAGICKKISAEAGITKQVTRSVFVYGGPGYSFRYFNIYDFDAGEKIEGKTNSFDLAAGFIFRIGWNYLLQLDAEKSLNHSYFSLGIGLGINLPKK